MELGSLRLKTGLAEMLKGGVIMDVVDAAQAKIAEDSGAVDPERHCVSRHLLFLLCEIRIE